MLSQDILTKSLSSIATSIFLYSIQNAHLKLLSDVFKRKVAKWPGGNSNFNQQIPHHFLPCKLLQTICRNKSVQFTLHPFLCCFWTFSAVFAFFIGNTKKFMQQSPVDGFLICVTYIVIICSVLFPSVSCSPWAKLFLIPTEKYFPVKNILLHEWSQNRWKSNFSNRTLVFRAAP